MTNRLCRAIDFVLFDIDGTLVRGGSSLQRAHMGAMARAIVELVGGVDRFEYTPAGLRYAGRSLSGFTDAGTIRLGLEVGGVPGAAMAAAERTVRERMIAHVLATPAPPDAPDCLLPGAAGAIAAPGASVAVGLCTGTHSGSPRGRCARWASTG